jgi:LysM repeat protein
VASEPPAGRYSVQTGDTLFFIGRRFGDSVAALQSANGLASTVIYPGQSLVVPSRGAASASVIALAAAPTTTYTVKRGDTLYFIARRYGTTWQALMAANGISDPRRLMPGQVLVIAGVGYAAELVSAAALPTAAIGEPLTGVYCGSGIAMTLDDRPAPDRGGRCTCVYAYGAHTAQRGGDLVDSTQQGLAPAQAAAAEVPQSNVFCGNGVYYFDYSAVTGYVNERFAPNTFWR